jgi:hypothetical protein
MPVTINPTSITFNDGSVQSSAASTSFNTVGSYCQLICWLNGNPSFAVNAGSNYASGSSGATGQVWAASIVNNYTADFVQIYSPQISGTWRWMSASTQVSGYNICFGLGVRVS